MAWATVDVASLCFCFMLHAGRAGTRARFRLALSTAGKQPACLLSGPAGSLQWALLDHMAVVALGYRDTALISVSGLGPLVFLPAPSPVVHAKQVEPRNTFCGSAAATASAE